ncbi:pentapeptide repeat-containing protein [Halobaculum sp. MBLA0147]|uniref:pentapeptide repeat-containing protein n=1 Tax=Halobaculum sp. MBLA0147 TaxID=3079934 RepID=UPI0035244D61
MCRYANLSGANLFDADLSEANLFYADLSEAILADADLSGANLLHADLSGANFFYTDLSEASLADADLSKGDLGGADLSKASLRNADVSEADLAGADLSGADLFDADLSEANIKHANLSGSNLSSTTAKNTNFRYALFGDPDTDHSPTNLENAVFRDTDFRGADFTDARLDQTDVTGARIDAETTFDAETIYERDDSVTSDQRDDADDAAPPSVWVHRRLERLHEENALSSVAREFHIRKQRARKRHYAAEANVGSWRERIPDHSLDSDTLQTQIGTLRDRLTRDAITSHAGDIRDTLTRERIRDRLQNTGGRLKRLGRHLRGNPVREVAQWVRGLRDWQAYVRWLQLRTFEVTMGYGERPSRVIGTSAACVVGCALLYPLGDWVAPNPGSVEAAQRGLGSNASGDVAVDAAVRYPAPPTDIAAVPSYLGSLTGTLADSLYFSTVTFTTLGFGDFSPVGFGRVLATVESALGVTLFAVLVFVLGRRATR